MTVAHDASSDSHTSTNSSVSQTSFSWTHTPVGTPRAVRIHVFQLNTAASSITGVSYGGVACSLVSGGTASDTATEPGRVEVWELNTGIPTGAQTVVVSRTNNAVTMRAHCITATAATDCETVGVTAQSENGAMAEVAISDGASLSNSVRYAAGYGGSTTISVGASSTALQNTAFPATAIRSVRETTAGQGSRNVGMTMVSDDRAYVLYAVREVVPPNNTPPTRAVDNDAALNTTTPKSADVGSVSAGHVLIAARAIENSNSAGDLGVPTIAAGAIGTFTEQATQDDNSDLEAGTRIASLVATGSTTDDVSMSRSSGAGAWAGNASRWTGSSGIGNAGTNGGGTATTVNFSPVVAQDRSALLIIIGDWNATDLSGRTLTIAGQTATRLMLEQNVGNTMSSAVYVLDDCGSAGAKLCQLDGAADKKLAISYIEILGSYVSGANYAITGSVPVTVTPAATALLEGEVIAGALTVTVTPAATALLEGEVIAGSLTVTATPTTTMLEGRVLAGATTVTATPAANLALGHELVGLTTLNVTPAATALLEGRVLAGLTTVTVTPMAASLLEGRILAGSVPVVVTPSAVMAYGREFLLVGDVLVTVAPAATALLEGRVLAGTLTVTATPSAVLLEGRVLAGALTVDVLVAATSLGNEKSFDGELVVDVLPSAVLVEGRVLAGALTVTVTPTSALNVGRVLAGALTVTVTPSATMLEGRVLGGLLTVTAVPASAMVYGADNAIAGALTVLVTPTAAFLEGRILAGALTVVITPAADMVVPGNLALEGSTAVTVTPAAAMREGRVLAGALVVSAVPSAVMLEGRRLLGALVVNVTVAAALFGDRSILGLVMLSVLPVAAFEIALFRQPDLHPVRLRGREAPTIRLRGRESSAVLLAGREAPEARAT